MAASAAYGAVSGAAVFVFGAAAPAAVRDAAATAKRGYKAAIVQIGTLRRLPTTRRWRAMRADGRLPDALLIDAGFDPKER